MTRILLQGVGNPSRGDDALGPLFIEAFTTEAGRVDKEWVYQLQVEQAEQWSHYDTVIIVDAHVRIDQPIEWRELEPAAEEAVGFSSHQIAPDAVLTLNRTYFAPHRPRAFLLGLQAESFELGGELSACARRALEEGLKFLRSHPVFDQR